MSPKFLVSQMKNLVLGLLLLCSLQVSAQWRTKYSTGGSNGGKQKLSIGGFLKSSNYFRYTDWSEDRVAENILHANLKFNWQLNKPSSVYLSVHNRYFFGETIENEESEYANSLAQSNNFVDMNWVFVEDDKSLLHTAVDRFYYQYKGKKMLVRAGKQRIDWSQTIVWNPNDFFNTFSFLNFDYETRSGIDALYGVFNLDRRGNSSLHIGYAPQTLITESIIAARYRQIVKNSEWQLMVGQLHEDYAVGFGWTTYINKTGFSGELSYFKDMNNVSENDVFMGTIASFYEFRSKLIVHYEFNYNSNPQNTIENFYSIFFEPLTTKYITFNKYSLATLAQYPLNKFWSIGATGIAYLDDERYYLGAYTKVNLPSKWSFLLSTQLMNNEDSGLFSSGKKYLFTRIMWSF